MENTLFSVETVLIQGMKRYSGTLQITENSLSFSGDKLTFRQAFHPGSAQIAVERVQVPGLLFRRSAEGCVLRSGDDLELRFVMEASLARHLQRVCAEADRSDAPAADVVDTPRPATPVSDGTPADTGCARKPEEIEPFDRPVPSADEPAIKPDAIEESGPVQSDSPGDAERGEPAASAAKTPAAETGMLPDSDPDAVIGAESEPAFIDGPMPATPVSDGTPADTGCARKLEEIESPNPSDDAPVRHTASSADEPAIKPDAIEESGPAQSDSPGDAEPGEPAASAAKTPTEETGMLPDSEPDALIGTESEPAFIDWLQTQIPQSDAQVLCLLFPWIDTLCRKRHLSNVPVQSITDIGKLEKIRQALDDPALLPDRLRRFHTEILNAMDRLMDYTRLYNPRKAIIETEAQSKPEDRRAQMEAEPAVTQIAVDAPGISSATEKKEITGGASVTTKKSILGGIPSDKRFHYWLHNMSEITHDAEQIKAIWKSIADLNQVSSKRGFFPGDFVEISDASVLDRLQKELFGPTKTVKYPKRAEKNIRRAIEVYRRYLEDCRSDTPYEVTNNPAHAAMPAKRQRERAAFRDRSEAMTRRPRPHRPTVSPSLVSVDESGTNGDYTDLGRKIESIEEDAGFDFGGANPQQRIAIQTTEGPLLIIAGPGTGKTFTLIKRIVYLVKRREVKPSQIMVVTFTDKAAKELISRIGSEFAALGLNVDLSAMYIGTFHAICRRILDESADRTRLSGHYRQLDDFDQKYLIFSNIWRFRRLPDYDLLIGQTKGVWRQAEMIARYLDQMTEEMVDIDALAQDEDPCIASLASIAREYQSLLKQENCIDFSGLLTEAYTLLEQNPDILEELWDRIRYIMVDEYQDTNYIQEQLIFLLGKKHNNICVVGDDDQGLYRFRGATIRNILEFPGRFGPQTCARVDLTTNYRSEPGIIDFYNAWMGKPEWFNWGRFRFDKQIMPGKQNPICDPSVLRCSAQGSVEDWAEKLGQMIRDMKETGFITDYNQIAFLCRSVKNDNIRQLISALEADGIPVYAPRSRMFFERQEVIELLGCMMCCFPDYCSRLQAADFEYANEELCDYYWEKCLPAAEALIRQNGELASFIQSTRIRHAGLDRPTSYAFTGILYRLLSFMPFKGYASTELGNVVGERPARNISTLLWALNKYEYNNNIRGFTPADCERVAEKLFNMHLRFLWKGGINEYEDDCDYAPSGCVSFMTIHQSKGLEFPVVLIDSLSATPRAQRDPIMDVIEAKYYRRKPFEPSGCIRYHDFWRLYYTAFSRARNLLILTCQEKKRGRQAPGVYFQSMYAPLPEYDKAILPPGAADEMRPLNLKKRYSFTSHISVYDSCTLQYRFFKELGFAQKIQAGPAFGKLVHQTIEEINRAIMNRRTQDITAENIQRWLKQNYARMSQAEHITMDAAQLDSCCRQVMRYAKNVKGGILHGDWNCLAAAEQNVALTCPDYILDGIVDMIVDNGDSMEIVDFKSERLPMPGQANERMEHYRQQLCLYAHLVEQKYQKPVSAMSLYFTGEENADPMMTFERSESDMQAALNGFDATIQRIEQNVFETGSGDPARCRSCEMRFYCGKEKPC